MLDSASRSASALRLGDRCLARPNRGRLKSGVPSWDLAAAGTPAAWADTATLDEFQVVHYTHRHHRPSPCQTRAIIFRRALGSSIKTSSVSHHRLPRSHSHVATKKVTFPFSILPYFARQSDWLTSASRRAHQVSSSSVIIMLPIKNLYPAAAAAAARVAACPGPSGRPPRPQLPGHRPPAAAGHRATPA